MDVYVTHCKRITQCCCGCLEVVKVTEPLLITKQWRKGDATSRKINLLFYYKPDHWLIKALDYLKLNPYNPSAGGAPRGNKVEFTPDQAAARTKLQMRKARLEQRKRELMQNPEHTDESIALIEEKIMSLYLEIAQQGGIPSTWLEDLVHGE